MSSLQLQVEEQNVEEASGTSATDQRHPEHLVPNLIRER